MIELDRSIGLEFEARPERELLEVGHTYQPHREILKPLSKTRIEIVPMVNYDISKECHKPIFEQELPDGGVFSFYAPLRDWFKAHEPESFEKIKENINKLPDKEYRILGDPYIHAILPLLPQEDQEMLLAIGKKGFKEDFGFEPKGIWLPESAVSSSTMKAILKSGYEFVVLREDQLENPKENPTYVEIYEKDKKLGDLAVVHYIADLSGSVSYNDHVTENADAFLERAKYSDRKTVSIATDTEFYGHHKKGRVEFLRYLTKPETLKNHGFGNFDIKKKLEETPKQYSKIVENTSWSCGNGHELGRWTGSCACGETRPSEWRLGEKKWLFQTLSTYGQEIDSRLDVNDPAWREKFTEFFLDIRGPMFSNGDVEVGKPGNERALMFAKACQLIGMTSCAWFFPEENRVEAKIAIEMIPEIEKLVPAINEAKLSKAA